MAEKHGGQTTAQDLCFSCFLLQRRL
ncbi:MAG: hypothetical protein U0694_26295 [Anaerolineae bacterium]